MIKQILCVNCLLMLFLALIVAAGFQPLQHLNAHMIASSPVTDVLGFGSSTALTTWFGQLKVDLADSPLPHSIAQGLQDRLVDVTQHVEWTLRYISPVLHQIESHVPPQQELLIICTGLGCVLVLGYTTFTILKLVTCLTASSKQKVFVSMFC